MATLVSITFIVLTILCFEKKTINQMQLLSNITAIIIIEHSNKIECKTIIVVLNNNKFFAAWACLKPLNS